jgi:uncharacterized protein with PIN domain
MKFEVFENYLAEQQGNAVKAGKVTEKAVEAERQYKSLIAEWETTLALSIKSGTDATKTLEQLDEKIDQAKRDMDRAAREREVYGRVARQASLTADDVIAAWNRDLNPQYYQKKIVPALDQLEATKKAYYDAMCDYFDKVYEIKDFREEVASQLGHEFPYRFQVSELQTTAEHDKYFIRQQDMDKAQSRNRGNQ